MDKVKLIVAVNRQIQHCDFELAKCGMMLALTSKDFLVHERPYIKSLTEEVSRMVKLREDLLNSL